ncbi:MAG: glycosyltransferase family 4 protein [Bacillota bacterium]|nr:glycosyltransferase family 4 protein [Bacillota bacterium]
MPTETLQYQLAHAFADAGFHVEVICPIPSRGITEEVRISYRHKKREVLKDGRFVITRFYMPREGKNPFLRAFRYFMQNAVQYWKAIHVKDADVLFCASTPPTQGALCGLIKNRLKIPFVYNLQDIFPDSMVNAGMTKKGSFLWKLGRRVEDYSYRKADQIIAISQEGKRNILAKGVPENKVKVIYNWANTSIQPVPREKNKLFDELDLDRDKFYITYAGNLGPVQNVGLLLDAADQLKEHKDIRFVIFGAGVEAQALADRAKNMSNVNLFPMMPQDRLAEVYSLGDLSLVIARKDLGAAAMPSKTWSILAAGTPVLLSYDEGSELWNLIEQHDCGVYVPADDANMLAEKIKQASFDKNSLARISNNALAAVKKEASFEVCSKGYVLTMVNEQRTEYSEGKNVL